MYHYLFTNDLRISVLDESLKKAGQCFTTDTVPPSSVDKSANNNMMTLGFYFTLNENSNCAKAAAAGRCAWSCKNCFRQQIQTSCLQHEK